MEKKWMLVIILMGLSVLALLIKSINDSSINESTNSEVISLDSTLSIEDEYQYFQECGFAVKAPCLLNDVSQQASGDFFLNYGGITNKENPDKIAFYQVIVNRLPIGYKDLNKQKLSQLVDKLMKKSFEKLNNCKSIRFSYDEYPGYTAECTTNGYGQKGVVFWKDEFIICLTVISNDNLNSKYNKFTNSFKNISVLSESANSNEKITESSVALNKQYSNKYFSLKYPTSWQIVQEDNQVTSKTNISVQIMEKQKNDYDFSPNINIIVSSKRWKEPTSYLAEQTIYQNRKLLDSYHMIRQKNDIIINNCKGSSIEYTFNMQGYILRGIQYIVKKQDNTTFIITATVDDNKETKQNDIINNIINTLIIQ